MQSHYGNIKIDVECSASFRRKRPVPLAASPMADEELKRLEPVSYSKRAALIVVIQKANETIRLCADYSSVQKCRIGAQLLSTTSF